MSIDAFVILVRSTPLVPLPLLPSLTHIEHCLQLLMEIERLKMGPPGDDPARRKFQTSWLNQFLLLSWRAFKQVWAVRARMVGG